MFIGCNTETIIFDGFRCEMHACLFLNLLAKLVLADVFMRPLVNLAPTTDDGGDSVCKTLPELTLISPEY